MLLDAPKIRLFHVLVATPAAATGRGGIDRVMAGLRSQLGIAGVDDIAVEFRATRGRGHIAFAPLYLAAFLLRMLVLRALGRLDLVHINLSSMGSTLRKLQVARLCRWLGVPYLIHLHGGAYPTYWKDDNSRLSRAILTMFNGAGLVIVLGEVWCRFVAERAPDAVNRVVVLPNAAPRPSLPHIGGGDSVHILFLGQLNAAKGVPQLGEALGRIRGNPNWRATLAGNGNLDEARAKAVELGIADRTDLPGWVDSPRVSELIASADILVLPSFVENLPLSIIEGMASGLAVVATSVGAIEDVITDGHTGLIVKAGDVDALTAALARLVEDAQLRARLGEAAMAVHAQRLELGVYARTVSSLWREVITAKRGRSGAPSTTAAVAARMANRR
ncbi:MAG: glycosyltransferase family 4 protein [Chthoniobacterales bacterium]